MAVPATEIDRLKQQITLQNATRNVPPEVRKTIAKTALESQIVQKQKSYYSTVRFQFRVTAPPASSEMQQGPYRYMIARGTKLVAFAYGENDEPKVAGFPPSFGLATYAETNLNTKGDTGGSTVLVYGVSLYLGELSDARLAKLIWANTFVDITLNGSDRYALLGRMGRIPSAGGLYGSGESLVSTPDTNSGSSHVGALTNGLPQADNFMRLAEPLTWNPTGQTDSRFQVRFEVARDISFEVRGRDNAGGAMPYSPPAAEGDVGTYVDVTTYLQTIEYTPRSTQA